MISTAEYVYVWYTSINAVDVIFDVNAGIAWENGLLVK
jgi:hypothetical protein